jgi:dTMP kinase
MKYALRFRKELLKHKYPGKYIAIEGIDGSGKSTQIEKIKNILSKDGYEVVITSEPMTEGAIQEIIRGALFSKIKLPSRAYQFLYSADRLINHETIIVPALRSGKIVLSHRSNWSTIPYGIIDKGGEYSFKKKAWQIAVANGLLSEYHAFLSPNITFYLKVSARKAVERLGNMQKIKDAYEKEEKLAKIVYGYDSEVAKFPKEFIVIDGEQEEKEVTNQILAKIRKML